MGATQLNDGDRREWVMNDEALYSWWRRSRIGLYRFVRENRAEITKAIRTELDRPPRETRWDDR
jgi:hypothetical protein